MSGSNCRILVSDKNLSRVWSLVSQTNHHISTNLSHFQLRDVFWKPRGVFFCHRNQSAAAVTVSTFLAIFIVPTRCLRMGWHHMKEVWGKKFTRGVWIQRRFPSDINRVKRLQWSLLSPITALRMTLRNSHASIKLQIESSNVVACIHFFKKKYLAINI